MGESDCCMKSSLPAETYWLMQQLCNRGLLCIRFVKSRWWPVLWPGGVCVLFLSQTGLPVGHVVWRSAKGSPPQDGESIRQSDQRRVFIAVHRLDISTNTRMKAMAYGPEIKVSTDSSIMSAVWQFAAVYFHCATLAFFLTHVRFLNK